MTIQLKILAVLFFLPFTVISQKVEKLYEKKLNLGLDQMVLVEHHLTRHPAKENHLLISGMYVNPKDSADYGCFSAVSTDNGIRWGHLKNFKVPEAADPWAEIMSNGTAVFTVLGFENLYVYTSTDGGIHWNNDSANLGAAHDHEVVLTNENTKKVFVTSVKGNDIYINSSSDYGKSFPSPKTFRFSNLSLNTMTPIILNDSIVLIPFSTFQARTFDSTGKLVSKFLKNNLQWVVSYNVSTSAFGTPSLICEDCERGFPVMAIDKSGLQFNNRLYYVCSNQTNNEILFCYSLNKGQNWSLPKPIKKYSTRPHSLRNRFTGIPQVAVNSKGIIGITWQDRTDDPEGLCNSLYFCFSSDGGINFSKPLKISSALSCMQKPVNSWAGERYKAGGDYMGLISRPNSNFQITWSDSRGGLAQLYIAEVRIF
jgi:hypothetical protein